MIISCIGDSLTEGDYGIRGKRGAANLHEKNYPYFLAQELQCETRNYGKCGFRSTEYLEYYLSGEVGLKGSDMVLIMLGTNGGHSIERETKANSAYEKLLGAIRKDVPEAKIFLLTPPHVTTNPKMSNCGYAEQVKNAVQYVRKLAAEENLPLIDVAEHKEFCAEHEEIYQCNDGLHFVEAGYRELAHFLAEQLRNALPDIFCP